MTGNDTGTARPIRVLLADDHSLFRKGLRHMLDIEQDIEVVGEARDGEEVQRLARELKPDVVLLDINMPVVDGIAAARELRQAAPQLGILMLTMFAEEDFLTRAVEAGANGYLLKDIPFDQIVTAVRAAARGEAVINPRVAARLIQEFRGERGPQVNPYTALTEREQEVLRLIAQGRSNGEIAAALAISEKTVKGHVSNVLSKLYLEDRTQAAIYAWREGFVRREP